MAFPFTAACDGAVATTSVMFEVGTGAPTSFEVSIESNSGGAPSSVLGHASDTSNPVSCTATDFTYGAPVNVTNGTTYWLVLSSLGTNNTNYYQYCGDATNIGGLEDLTGVPNWSATAGDPNAHLFIGDVAPPPPPPDWTNGATSSPDQAQQNLSTAVWLFIASMFGMLWIMRKH